MKQTKLMLHHSLTEDSGTVSWSAIRRYHRHTKGWNDIGYNWGIELAGDEYEVLLGRPTNGPGAHCKEANMNHLALSVCFVGNFDKTPPTPAHVEVFRERIWLPIAVEQFGLVPGDIVFHRDFSPWKSCPGTAFTRQYLSAFIAGLAV